MKSIPSSQSLCFVHFLLFLLITLLTAILQQEAVGVSCQPQHEISKNFADVIEAATYQYVNSQEWKDHLIKSNIYLSLPECAPVKFPATFDFKRNYMIMCYDAEAFEPWISIHELSGILLAQTIKEQYGMVALQPIFKKIPSDGGYFNAMKNGVDSGACDVIVGATNWNAERMAQAKFQCAYGKSYQGWLRSELQNSTVKLNTIQDLDKPGVIVVVSRGTSFQNYVDDHFTKATIKVIVGYADAWALITNRTAHAYISDVLDLYYWLGNNRENCSNCEVRMFGDPTNFGTFVTNNINMRVSGGGLGNFEGSIAIVLIFVFISMILLL